MKTAGKMFCFVVLLVFCVMGQISIGYEDVMEWGDRRGTSFRERVSGISQEYPDLNTQVTIGEDVTWDFSNYPVFEVDSQCYIDGDPWYIHVNTENYYTKHESELDSNYIAFSDGDTAYVNGAILLKQWTETEGFVESFKEDDISFFGYHKIDSQYLLTIIESEPSVYACDTLFEFDLAYGDEKTQIITYFPEDDYQVRDSLIRSVNSYGTFIMPDGEEVEALGIRELHFISFLDIDIYGEILQYSFYSKEYGLLGNIYYIFDDTAGFPHTSWYSLYNIHGESYDMCAIDDSIGRTSSFHLFYTNLNSQGSINHNFPSKTYALSEITDKTYYDLMGRKLSVKDQIDNGYSGVVILKGGRKGRVLKKLMVGEN